jgi:hypothetical protein
MALAALASSAGGLTFATFNAGVTNGSSTSAATALYSPPIVFAQSSGHAADVKWNPASPGNNGNGNGYAVSKTAVQASSACPGTISSYANYVTSAAPSGSAITVTEAAGTVYTAATEGSWVCYVVQTGYNTAGGPPWVSVPAWNSLDTLQALPVQIGFVASSFTMVNGGTAGRLDPGDIISVKFNQPIVVPAGVTANTDTICAANVFGVGIIVLAGTTTIGPCVGLEAADLGWLTGAAPSANVRFNATYVVTNNADGTQTIKATVGARVSGTNPAISGAFTLAPNPALTSQRGSPAAAICPNNTGGGKCLPTGTSGL